LNNYNSGRPSSGAGSSGNPSSATMTAGTSSSLAGF